MVSKVRSQIKLVEELYCVGVDCKMAFKYRSALKQVILVAERYEKLRRLNVTEFSRLFELNLKGFNFDELVDKLK